MKKSKHACCRYQLVQIGGWSCLGLLLCLLFMASGRAAATEGTNLKWQPAKCRTNGSQPSSNPAMPDEPFFVDAAQARKVLTTAGTGRFEINSMQGKRLTVHVFRPSQFDKQTGRIWFVMHGTSRNAKRYLQVAAPVAERHQVLAVVVEFSRKNYPTGDSYTLGNISRGRAEAYTAGESQWSSLPQTPYIEIERAFTAISGTIQSQQPGYYLFGHSAGAQFVHRLLTFSTCPRVIRAVAANAGWYTLPTIDKKQPPFPYSLRGAAREAQDPRSVLSAPLTILLGTKDTEGNEEDRNLRVSAGAMAQGANRLERGKNYYEAGLQAAGNANVFLAWKIQLVPGAGHEVAEVIASAGQLLFAPASETTCGNTNSPSSDAAQITLQEVLVVPPQSHEDVNQDGVINLSEDQFVEMVNKSDQPACLAGWTLQTASGRGGHLFPISQALLPGQAVIVFGGGLPRGYFGSAEIQNASGSRGLDMQPMGDVLRLIDERGKVSDSVSWGDCAKSACAVKHVPTQMQKGGSITLSERKGLWQHHKEVSRQLLSPGFWPD